jgi:cell division protein FtsW (lipid II flippase)
LPFISYGGSSVVGNFVLTGLLLVVSENAGKRSAGEERADYGRVSLEKETV